MAGLFPGPVRSPPAGGPSSWAVGMAAAGWPLSPVVSMSLGGTSSEGESPLCPVRASQVFTDPYPFLVFSPLWPLVTSKMPFKWPDWSWGQLTSGLASCPRPAQMSCCAPATGPHRWRADRRATRGPCTAHTGSRGSFTPQGRAGRLTSAHTPQVWGLPGPVSLLWDRGGHSPLPARLASVPPSQVLQARPAHSGMGHIGCSWEVARVSWAVPGVPPFSS